MSRGRTDNAISPSLLATGASNPVANITSVDTCTGTPISKGVSSHMTEYASAGGPSYSETVGPISDDIAEDYPGSKQKDLKNFKENLLVFLDSLILECQDGPVFD